MANSNQNIETPDAFVRAVEAFYGIKFKYDMAGTEENKKAPTVFTEAQDSLSIDWPTDGWCWLNPPFRNVGKWVQKCLEQTRRECKIVSVWPLSGDLNQIDTWKYADVTVVHGRVWPEVRGVMLCMWSSWYTGAKVYGLRWDKKSLKLEWRRW